MAFPEIVKLLGEQECHASIDPSILTVIITLSTGRVV
jgi:hypothetical protein